MRQPINCQGLEVQDQCQGLHKVSSRRVEAKAGSSSLEYEAIQLALRNKIIDHQCLRD